MRSQGSGQVRSLSTRGVPGEIGVVSSFASIPERGLLQCFIEPKQNPEFCRAFSKRVSFNLRKKHLSLLPVRCFPRLPSVSQGPGSTCAVTPRDGCLPSDSRGAEVLGGRISRGDWLEGRRTYAPWRVRGEESETSGIT